MSRNRFTGITSRFLMLIVAGVQAMTYLSVLVNPSKVWVMTIFGLLFIPVALVNLFLLVWAVKRRSRAFLIPFLAILPSVFFVGKYVQSPFGHDSGDGMPDAGGQDAVRVVTYNVGRFSSAEGIEDPGKCMDSVALFLKSCDADVICLQEVHAGSVMELKEYLSGKFSGYKSEYYVNIGRRGCSGNVTLSRFPVRGKGVVSFEKSANMALYTDYRIRGEDIRIYNCHLESYALSLPSIVKSIRNHDRSVFRKTEERVRTSITRRPEQVDLILEDVASSPLSAFVCGDFNDNPMSHTYFRLSRGRSDSFVEAGTGFGATYSLLWPMLRIDYILFPRRFSAVWHKTFKIDYSDHYPVVSDVVIP